MVFHCALRVRRLQGLRFVLDVPGSPPAIHAKSLISLSVFAVSWTIVRFSEVVFFLPRPPQREKACFSTVSEHFRGANVGGFFLPDPL